MGATEAFLYVNVDVRLIDDFSERLLAMVAQL